MSSIINWEATKPIWESMPDVLAVWSFGSAQDGTVRDGSDADVAVLSRRPISFDQQLDLLGRLQTALGMEAVDLVLLDKANPILSFEAVKGRLLFCRDQQAMAAFVSLTARVYEDEMAMWQRAVAARA